MSNDVYTMPSVESEKPWTNADDRRAHLLIEALTERDPDCADKLEEEFVRKYIKPDVRALDSLVFQNRCERYARLTPMRATDLLAAVYNRNFEFGTYGLRSETESEIEDGLAAASLDAIRHLWRIRQDADVLGIDYEDHVALLFKIHKARGHSRPPMLKEMHGEVVMAAVLSYLIEEAEALE